jgi:ketosteroid isomerase-like protein
MRSRYVVSLVFAFCLGGLVTDAVQNVMDEIRSAEAGWMSARLAGNREAYAELLADDFTWTFTTGRVLSRQQSIDALQPRPAPKLTSTVQAYDRCAVVAGNATLLRDGKPVQERFVRVWSKANDRWRAVHFQATEIEQSARN